MEFQIKIGFIGNHRNSLNCEQKHKIISILNKYDNIIVSHGDCIGSDTDFHNLCINYRNDHPNKKIRIQIFPTDDLTFRAFNEPDLLMVKKSKSERNLYIIKNSSILIASPIDKNKEQTPFETWSLLRKARQQKLLIYII
jgi:hypothetical protein